MIVAAFPAKVAVGNWEQKLKRMALPFIFGEQISALRGYWVVANDFTQKLATNNQTFWTPVRSQHEVD